MSAGSERVIATTPFAALLAARFRDFRLTLRSKREGTSLSDKPRIYFIFRIKLA